MKLGLKFSLIFVLIFGAGGALAGYICNRFLQESARAQVLQQARLMLETALATRRYTSEQILPVIEANKRRDPTFHAQIVPGYAATENFNYLRVKYPEYTYKEATLNPTNLRDRATDWEADIVKMFRNSSTQTEFVGERDSPVGRTLVLARPIVAKQSCMECHSTVAAAPASMIKIYGTANGFSWKTNEVIGAQVISVPMAVPVQMASEAFRSLMISLAAIGVVTLIILNLAVSMMVVKPIKRLAGAADEISRGRVDIPELPVKGQDEVSTLAASFNRMHRSLSQALKMLGH